MQGTNPGGGNESGKPPMLNYMSGSSGSAGVQHQPMGANPSAAGSGLRKLSLNTGSNAGGNAMGGIGGAGIGFGLGGAASNMGSFRGSNPGLPQSRQQQSMPGLSSGMPGAQRDSINNQDDNQHRPSDQPFRGVETPQRSVQDAGAGFANNPMEISSQFGEAAGGSAFPRAQQYQSAQSTSGLNQQNLQSFNQRVAMTADRANFAGNQAINARPGGGAMSTAGFSSYQNPLLTQSERAGGQAVGGMLGNATGGLGAMS